MEDDMVGRAVRMFMAARKGMMSQPLVMIMVGFTVDESKSGTILYQRVYRAIKKEKEPNASTVPPRIAYRDSDVSVRSNLTGRTSMNSALLSQQSSSVPSQQTPDDPSVASLLPTSVGRGLLALRSTLQAACT